MEATNFTNVHEQLGVGSHVSPACNHAPRQTDDITNDTVKPGPLLREYYATRDFAHEPGNNSATPARNTDADEAKHNVIRSTEIGDPNGRIPKDQRTRDQLNAVQDDLAAIQRNNTSPGTRQVAHGEPQARHGGSGAVALASQRTHRNSNYAPGYEDAADAVRPKFYNADHHRPSLLAHEPVTPLSELPPDLGNDTQQASTDRGPGVAPGPSIAQKAQAPLAKIHGAGEVLRGNLAAAADNLMGDRERQAKDEEIVRKGQAEFTNGRFDKAQASRVEH